MNDNQRRFAEKTSNQESYNAGNHADLLQHAPIASEYVPSGYTAEPKAKKKQKTKADKILKATGLILVALFAIFLFLAPSSSTVDTSPEAIQAAQSSMSTQLPLGVRILTKDEMLGGQDLTITHSSPSNERKVHIWDYAAEDGDYVQILVNGVAIGDPFMIKNKPVVFTVPTTGEIQVLGTRDGGGGITYAIHYEVNSTTYFNSTNFGDGNMYTLIRE